MERRKGDTKMARCREIILDSSVVVKWFSSETKSVEALALLDSYTQGTVELVVSEVLYCEVANALRYHCSTIQPAHERHSPNPRPNN
jgi:predicted nucleic acid-binding protein